MENLSTFITRIAVAALTSALFCAAAVFFVVDISLRGVETAVIATNERFDDVNARFDGVNTRFDSLERSMERSTDLLREEIRAGFAGIGQDIRNEVEVRGLAQDENIELAMSAILSMMLTLETDENDVAGRQERMTALRVQVAIICRDVLGRDHPDCARLP